MKWLRKVKQDDLKIIGVNQKISTKIKIEAMKYTRSAPTQWYLNSTSEKNINKGIQQNLKTVILFGKFILFLQSNHSLHKL